MLFMFYFLFCFFYDPLAAAQQLFDEDLKRHTTTLCAVGGLQQNHVFNSTLCAITVADNQDSPFLAPAG